VPIETRLRRVLDWPFRSGVLAAEVSQDGPAARAGLCPGDLVLSFGGIPVSGVDDLHRLLSGERSGQPTQIEVLRRGERHMLMVVPEDAS